MQMQKAKKRVSTVFLFTLISMFLIMGLAACGNSEPEETPPATTATPSPSPAPAQTPEPTPPPEPQDTPEADLSLIGAWRWADDESFLYTFHADGTGVRGFEWQGLSPFEWYLDTEYGILDIATFPVIEEWAFAVVEEDGMFFLVIESLQVPGLAFMYLFTDYAEDVAPEDYSILLGIWAWVDDFGNVHPWDYVFFSDGSGIRGTTEAFDVFFWEADYATGELIIYIPSVFEEWDITLTADSFTVSSPELPGVRLIYNRIN